MLSLNYIAVCRHDILLFISSRALIYTSSRRNLYKMSKKLKLDVLTKPRSLRSENKGDSKNISTTSGYFDDKDASPKKIVKKKHTPVKIKHEEMKDAANSKNSEIKIEDLQQNETVKKDRAPVKIKYEEMKDVTDSKNTEIKVQDLQNKTVKKKRTPVKIEYEEMKNATESKPNEVKVEDLQDGTVKNETVEDKWMPLNWETILENVKEMRKHKTAPVDEMGCHKCIDPNATAKVARYQSLIALMLSSQTKDQVTHAAMQRLITYGCTPELISGTPDDTLGKLIYPVGFWKV